jgi:hypothetical protein
VRIRLTLGETTCISEDPKYGRNYVVPKDLIERWRKARKEWCALDIQLMEIVEDQDVERRMKFPKDGKR